jgi:hypothetical protein
MVEIDRESFERRIRAVAWVRSDLVAQEDIPETLLALVDGDSPRNPRAATDWQCRFSSSSSRTRSPCPAAMKS